MRRRSTGQRGTILNCRGTLMRRKRFAEFKNLQSGNLSALIAMLFVFETLCRSRYSGRRKALSTKFPIRPAHTVISSSRQSAGARFFQIGRF